MADRKITPISYQKLVKIFELEGFVVKRQKGDHLILTKQGVKRPLVIKTSPRNVAVTHIIENLGLKPRRFTTALLLNINTFTKYMLKCETWKKPILTDFTPHQNKSRYCGALWAV
jgi:predicted RNA binding protein YcfA (HicA-like mRNA interferase family)